MITDKQLPQRQHAQRSQPLLLSALIGEFLLSHINEFFQSYRTSAQPVSEIVDGFDHLIESLDKFFDCLDDFEEDLDLQDTKIQWYANAKIASGELAHTTNKFYNYPTFSDISLRMNESESNDYRTNNGTCFAKVIYYLY